MFHVCEGLLCCGKTEFLVLLQQKQEKGDRDYFPVPRRLHSSSVWPRLTSTGVRGSNVEMLPLSRKSTATKLTVVAKPSKLVAVNDTCRSKLKRHTKQKTAGSVPLRLRLHITATASARVKLQRMFMCTDERIFNLCGVSSCAPRRTSYNICV